MNISLILFGVFLFVFGCCIGTKMSKRPDRNIGTLKIVRDEIDGEVYIAMETPFSVLNDLRDGEIITMNVSRK